MQYSEEQYFKALEVYEKTKSVTKTITILGYPARRQTLYNQINRRRLLPEERSTFRGYNTPEHPRHPSLEFKLEILHRCFELGETVQSVASETGYSTASIYQWRLKYIRKGAAALMKPDKAKPRVPLVEGQSTSSKEIEELKAQIQDMQLEIDILKETLNVIKKDPGANQKPTSNREKAVIVDALKGKYPLPTLLNELNMAKSSYYYQKKRIDFQTKYEKAINVITAIFHENNRVGEVFASPLTPPYMPFGIRRFNLTSKPDYSATLCVLAPFRSRCLSLYLCVYSSYTFRLHPLSGLHGTYICLHG